VTVAAEPGRIAKRARQILELRHVIFVDVTRRAGERLRTARLPKERMIGLVHFFRTKICPRCVS